MTSVRFDPILKARLKRVAEITEKTVSEVIREAVEKHCNAVLQEETLDVVLADVIGTLDSGGQSNATRIKEVFGEILEEKKRTGHL